jgi:L-histidine Nalpha-methyltransferase
MTFFLTINVKRKTMTTNRLLEEVIAGLQANPKRLPPGYFYDETGSRLFQQIMWLPEYYLTRSEFEILEQHKTQLVRQMLADGTPFELIEPGSGDGLKTRILLRHLMEQKADFRYVPIDISPGILKQLTCRLAEELPGLQVVSLAGTYMEMLKQHTGNSGKVRKVILFLGANIGNFPAAEALDFMQQLRLQLDPGDQLLLGIDWQKHPGLILAAYNDPQGVTKAFNLNLLCRLNREMDADFELSQFSHFALYDPASGEARSYLVSEKKQQVYLRKPDVMLDFAWGETIHTEISRKYTPAGLQNLAVASGFDITATFQDCKGYFADVLLIAI